MVVVVENVHGQRAEQNGAVGHLIHHKADVSIKEEDRIIDIQLIQEMVVVRVARVVIPETNIDTCVSRSPLPSIHCGLRVIKNHLFSQIALLTRTCNSVLKQNSSS